VSDLRGLQAQLQGACLYGIADLGYLAPNQLAESTKKLLEGGIDVLQLRAKGRAEDEILAWAQALAPLCRDAGVPFIVNDHVDLAREAGADGVHLGQDDGSLKEARARLPEGALVGRSTHSPAQAAAALREGADYIGFGPLFPTPTKEGREGIGLADVDRVEREVGVAIPVFCIGGIKLDNLPGVLAAGARRVVVVSGLLTADDVAARCRAVRQLVQDARA
jgi:thiamine-phosphate pyrophosphorylase